MTYVVLPLFNNNIHKVQYLDYSISFISISTAHFNVQIVNTYINLSSRMPKAVFMPITVTYNQQFHRTILSCDQICIPDDTLNNSRQLRNFCEDFRTDI